MQQSSNMIRNATFGLLAAVTLVACDNASGGQISGGIASLGSDFVRAFSQGPNDTPIPLDDVTLTQTPTIEPFNP